MNCPRRSVFVFIFCACCAAGAGIGALAQPGARPRPLVTLDLPAPKLVGAPDNWLNTEGKPLSFEKGRVHIVHFWAFGCINCKRNLPAYSKWASQFAGKPLTVLGIHTPETAREKDPANVLDAMDRHGITYPVLIDGAGINWRRWRQQMWPTVYLVDKRGHVRAYWMGELEWEDAGGTRIMSEIIGKLLREPAPPSE